MHSDVSPTSRTDGAPAIGRNTLFVTAGAMVANICAYLVHVPASRWLGAELYGEFAALLSVQLIASVPALALQLVAARDRVLGTSVTRLRRTGRKAALWLALLLTAAIWPVSEALTTSTFTVIAAVLAAPLLCIFSVELGLLQADGHFLRFAVLSAGLGLAKAGPAVTLLALSGTVAPALAAEAAGIATAALAARWAVGRTHLRPPPHDLVDVAPRTNVWSVARAAQVQLALMALTTADVLLARSLLDAAAAGNYALGAIATKIAFWLPAAVVTVLFPQMARPEHHATARRYALLLVAIIGAALAAAAALAAPLVEPVAGVEYAPVAGVLWLFIAIGAVQSLIQVVLLASIAAHRSHETAVVWVGVTLIAAPPVLAAHFAYPLGARLLTVTGLATWVLLALATTAITAAIVARINTARVGGTPNPHHHGDCD